MKNTQNLTIIATEIVKASAYTLKEIRAEYKSGKSEGWRRGFFAAHGLNFLQGQIIEKGLL